MTEAEYRAQLEHLEGVQNIVMNPKFRSFIKYLETRKYELAVRELKQGTPNDEKNRGVINLVEWIAGTQYRIKEEVGQLRKEMSEKNVDN